VKEVFLHYLWRFQKFDRKGLRTTAGAHLQVIHPGILNAGAGPDFLNAQIHLAGLLWSGSVEIHLQASDWYRHQHQNDDRYDNVILHVVWEADASVLLPSGEPLPTLLLSEFVSPQQLTHYQKTFLQPSHFIACEQSVQRFSEADWSLWKERLFIERMESRIIAIESLRKDLNNDWEAVLFVLLAKAFGLNQNGVAFQKMALQTDFKIIRKIRSVSDGLEALLMGQAGLLNTVTKDPYALQLKKQYDYFKQKFNFQTPLGVHCTFARLRPPNFPTLRLAQLAQLFVKHESLLEAFMECKTPDYAFQLFEIQLPSYWEKHYNFGAESARVQKKISRNFFELVAVNALLPIRFAYAHQQHKKEAEKIFEWAQLLAAEQNETIKKFKALGVTIDHAGASQALLHLKKNYCDSKRCLSCNVGFQLMKN